MDCSKQMSALWRPECRFIGVLCEGHSEGYYIGDCDLIKGASHDLTLISHVITEVQQSCQEKGIQLPGILRLQSDNASSELKNVLQDVSMIFLDDFYGNSYGISLRFLCYSMLFLWDFCGIPLGFPWYFYDPSILWDYYGMSIESKLKSIESKLKSSESKSKSIERN